MPTTINTRPTVTIEKEDQRPTSNRTNNKHHNIQRICQDSGLGLNKPRRSAILQIALYLENPLHELSPLFIP
jgi:hypothetical protein